MGTVELEQPPSVYCAEVTGTRDSISIPASAWKFQGFLEWVWSNTFPTYCHATFAGGELFIDMSPENYETHNAVKFALYAALWGIVRKHNLGRAVCDDMLFVNEDAEVSTEPDAAFASWETLRSGRARFEANLHGTPMMELHGTPDWVAEIVSPSSVRKDTVRLRELYHRAGIPEYWLIDVRGAEVSFQVLRHGADDYTAIEPIEGWLPSAVFGRRFRLERFRDPVGLLDYTLHVDPA
jgi:Uma2 family endonuclease